jgi:uncharacterized membrane protein YgcG
MTESEKDEETKKSPTQIYNDLVATGFPERLAKGLVQVFQDLGVLDQPPDEASRSGAPTHRPRSVVEEEEHRSSSSSLSPDTSSSWSTPDISSGFIGGGGDSGGGGATGGW